VTDEVSEFYIITMSGRTLQLRAADSSERDAWIKTLAPKTSLVEMLVFREQVCASARAHVSARAGESQKGNPMGVLGPGDGEGGEGKVDRV
jgi:hypothetical protein